MGQSLVIWILIGLGLITANLPFLTERHLLALPWAQPGEPARASWLRWMVSLLFFAALAVVGWIIKVFIGGAFFVLTDAGSVVLYLLRVAAVLAAACAVLWVPGYLLRDASVGKPFFPRLLEVLVLYALVGTLGFAFESSIGNPFAQTWEFYAITLSLFLVLAYPGFVYRYLMRRRKAHA